MSVEGGGFKNRYGASSMVLLPLVADNVGLPIIAAGGICDGRTMAAAFVLGADGMQMGTRLLTCAESPVHDIFKRAVIDADETSTVLLPLGGVRMMRAIRTATAELMDSGQAPEAHGSALERVRTLYFDGDMAASVANSGQVAGRIAEITPAADTIAEMWAGSRDVLAAIAGREAREMDAGGLGIPE